ncbi:vacuolar protein sorting-associated protein 62 [Cocos nucifera]|uniref:Vacuolar protein sorting-associated protein 62 n=1 Tax=Cocos nucifera TaxID=13894 RepID=A0A8K0N501_COCNU|nr:vacuolar protein sorting-associated protein 62 [Cocos nucifera]
MAEWKWWCWHQGKVTNFVHHEPEPFSLPSPIPEWPQGEGFAEGKICIGELEVVKVTKFQSIWSCHSSSANGATFYQPSEIPDGFISLGHYGQPIDRPLHGFVLVVRELTDCKATTDLPALQKPLDYTLVWSSADWTEDDHDDCGYFWLPSPPEGYKSLGYLVTKGPNKPSLEEVRCVRCDLTEKCEAYDLIVDMEPMFPEFPCQIWKTRPCIRGMWEKGLSVGTFFCSTNSIFEDELSISCLKNLDSSLQAMPNLEQIHALMKQYGPTVFFHPKECYLPSSVSWFFENGATLYTRGIKVGEDINAKGSNLPFGGENDGEYWIDLPEDERAEYVKLGSMDSCELYVHVKPALGGTFTDLAIWVFCPFNGPATIKIGVASFSLSKIGRHVGDWEHFTLRISNYTGELWSIFFSQHSGGEWVDASGLEFIEGNKAVVYSSKSGHASFPHAGTYLQGSEKLGIGVRNDAAQSNLSVDSSVRYQIVAAEYLGDAVSEPNWLQYMREWGPTVIYNSRTELDRILGFLPFNLRFTVENIFDSLPMELYGEEGPTGPKEKDNWEGDERC